MKTRTSKDVIEQIIANLNPKNEVSSERKSNLRLLSDTHNKTQIAINKFNERLKIYESDPTRTQEDRYNEAAFDAYAALYVDHLTPAEQKTFWSNAKHHFFIKGENVNENYQHVAMRLQCCREKLLADSYKKRHSEKAVMDEIVQKKYFSNMPMIKQRSRELLVLALNKSNQDVFSDEDARIQIIGDLKAMQEWLEELIAFRFDKKSEFSSHLQMLTTAIADVKQINSGAILAIELNNISKITLYLLEKFEQYYFIPNFTPDHKVKQSANDLWQEETNEILDDDLEVNYTVYANRELAYRISQANRLNAITDLIQAFTCEPVEKINHQTPDKKITLPSENELLVLAETLSTERELAKMAALVEPATQALQTLLDKNKASRFEKLKIHGLHRQPSTKQKAAYYQNLLKSAQSFMEVLIVLLAMFEDEKDKKLQQAITLAFGFSDPVKVMCALIEKLYAKLEQNDAQYDALVKLYVEVSMYAGRDASFKIPAVSYHAMQIRIDDIIKPKPAVVATN